jgi:hypothetical protein
MISHRHFYIQAANVYVEDMLHAVSFKEENMRAPRTTPQFPTSQQPLFASTQIVRYISLIIF